MLVNFKSVCCTINMPIFFRVQKCQSFFRIARTAEKIVRASSKFTFSTTTTAQKMKFSINDLFSKCDQIRKKLRIWSNLLKKSLMDNFFFCAVLVLIKFWEHWNFVNHIIFNTAFNFIQVLENLLRDVKQLQSQLKVSKADVCRFKVLFRMIFIYLNKIKWTDKVLASNFSR